MFLKKIRGDFTETAKKRDFLVNIGFLVVVGAIIFLIFKFMLGLLLPFVIGVILSYLVQKPSGKIGNKFKIDKGICAAVFVTVSYIVAISILVLMIWGVLSAISSFISNKSNLASLTLVFEKMQLAMNKVSDNFSIFGNAGQMFDKVKENTLNEIVSFASSLVGKTARSLPSFLFSCIVTVVASFYMAKDYDKLLKFLKGFLSPKTVTNIATIKSILVENVFKLAKGYIVILLITFAELSAGFFVIGVKKPVVLAFFIALVDILPVIGTGTVLIPWSIICFITEGFGRGFMLLLLYVVIIVVRNFAEPKIIGKKVGLNPLFMLLVIFVGLRLAGVGGMLMLPIVLIVVVNFYKKQMVSEKDKTEKSA